MNFEFRNGVWVGNRETANRHSFYTGVKAEPVVDDNAILKESVLGRACAIHRNQSCPFADQAGVLHGGVRPGRHRQKVGVVASAERKFRNCHGRCHRAKRRTCRLNRFDFGLNANGVGRSTHFQRPVQYGGFGDAHFRGRNLHTFEARQFKPYFVIARRQKVQAVASVLARDCRAALASIQTRCGDHRARQDGT